MSGIPDDLKRIIRALEDDGGAIGDTETPDYSGLPQEDPTDGETPGFATALQSDPWSPAYLKMVLKEWEPTPRGIAVLVAFVLATIALVLLIVLLVMLMMNNDEASVTDTAGIEAQIIIRGPGRGAHPQFDRPSGVDIGPDGRIYVADSGNNRIVVFDRNGEFEAEFGGLGVAKPLPGARRTWEPGRFSYPVDVVVDDRGRIYVADFYNDSISVFDKDREFITRFPDPSSVVGKGGSGQEGTGIAVTAIDVVGTTVYATDTYQVVVFADNGEVLRQFGMPGEAKGSLEHPNGIAADAVGRLFVSDSNNNRIQAFEPDGRVLWTLGERSAELQSETDAPLALPRGLALQVDGTLLVADPIGQRLVKIGQDGRMIASYGTRGQAPGQLSFPNDVSADGDRVVIADTANNRVQVVRLTGR